MHHTVLTDSLSNKLVASIAGRELVAISPSTYRSRQGARQSIRSRATENATQSSPVSTGPDSASGSSRYTPVQGTTATADGTGAPSNIEIGPGYKTVKKVKEVEAEAAVKTADLTEGVKDVTKQVAVDEVKETAGKVGSAVGEAAGSVKEAAQNLAGSGQEAAANVQDVVQKVGDKRMDATASVRDATDSKGQQLQQAADARVQEAVDKVNEVKSGTGGIAGAVTTEKLPGTEQLLTGSQLAATNRIIGSSQADAGAQNTPSPNAVAASPADKATGGLGAQDASGNIGSSEGKAGVAGGLKDKLAELGAKSSDYVNNILPKTASLTSEEPAATARQEGA